jgi:hypothetical protein
MSERSSVDIVDMKAQQLPGSVALCGSALVDLPAAAEGKPSKRPTFDINAYNGGLLRVGAFYRPVVVDLGGLRAAGPVAILLDHDSSQIVGQSSQTTIGAAGINLKGTVTGDYATAGEAAHKVVSQAANGFQWSSSVGVTVEKVEAIGDQVAVKVNGKDFTGPIMVVRAGRLGEVSFVAVGADETASAKVAATAAQNWESSNMTQANQTQADVAAQGTTTAAQPAPAPALSTAPAAKPEAEIRAEAAKAERDRLGRIEASCKGFTGKPVDDLRAKATSGEITHETLLAGLLDIKRSDMPQAPVIHAGGVPQANEPEVLEAALCMTAKLPDMEKSFTAPTLEAAAKSFRRGIGIGELLLARAELNTGRRYSLRRDSISEVLRAAFSNSDLSGILSNTATKFLLSGYATGDNSDVEISSVRSVSDFKAITSYRMTGNGEFQEVGPGGELKNGTLGEESYTNQAKTYGLLYGISRTDIVNDDLGAFDQLRTRVGMGAAMKRRKVVWSAFMANSAFFTAARKNYAEGAGTALGDTALAQAEQMFLDQTDADGNKLGLMPALLLVPTALSATSRRYYVAQEIRDTTASTKYPTANIWQNRFRPVTSQYLGLASMSGYSAAAWYLLANPAEAATIEVCYLNGVQQPTIEVAEADFDVLGIQMRGFFDFGVALQDYRAGVKMKGIA